MSRDVQHICWRERVDVAKREGQKVKAICGARVYPMTEMKDEIPMCTPCTKELMRRFDAVTRPVVWTATVTTSTNTWPTTGGAA